MAGVDGAHLDALRQFYPAADIKRLVDILAWLEAQYLPLAPD